MLAHAQRETAGAWIIHHGRKLRLDTRGATDFPAIDRAEKIATLLTYLGGTQETTIASGKVKVIASASGLNPTYELDGLLPVLEEKRLIERTQNGIAVLGVSNHTALIHARDIFLDADPDPKEKAAISLAETASICPVRRSDVFEEISDYFKLDKAKTDELLNRSRVLGLVDTVGIGESQILFNGNLYRRESAYKIHKTLESLSTIEKGRILELTELLRKFGCLSYEQAEKMLTLDLLERLIAIGMFDLNRISNDDGEHSFVSDPSAFHKFIDPLVDDCFDLAKALVTALTYGMRYRSPIQGRIYSVSLLLEKLIVGEEVGPATAIGKDYRALELSRVVDLREDSDNAGRFYMKLNKIEVGQLAMQVLTDEGDVHAESLTQFRGASMNAYGGPEDCRVPVRLRQTDPSKYVMRDMLETLRAGRNY